MASGGGGGGSRRRPPRAGGGGSAVGAVVAAAVGGAARHSEDDGPKQRNEAHKLSEAVAAADREGGYPSARLAFETHPAASELAPSSIWRVHLELAECAKRGGALPHVKHHLSYALQAQPKTAQVWLEACRTLDELGELDECRWLLERGLQSCAPNEQLSLKLVRVLERLGDYQTVRALAASQRWQSMEKSWKVLLDAAHFEARAGNGDSVRRFAHLLLQRLPYQGPIYCEVCRIEAILGNWSTALQLAEQGVQACPKYGPLWFALLRYAEKLYGAQAVHEYGAQALKSMCHELHWKVHFEVAAAFGREHDLRNCRRAIESAALACPRHLRWKVWLLAARSELWDGSVIASRKLLAQAKADAPSRVQVSVCVERARAEEILNDLQAVRAALQEAHSCEGHDWKVFLEQIFVEARHGNLDVARDVTLAALEMHPATGRLWSALISLEHSGEGGTVAAMAAFRRAAKEVPKSGEVWCEGARLFMNPLGRDFHLARARKCLEFAVHLTPQYGDSFLELLRLRFLLELRSRMRNDSLAVGLLGAPGAQLPGPGAADGARLSIATLVARRVCSRASAELKYGRFDFGFVEGDRLDPAAEQESESGVFDWVGLCDPRVPGCSSATALPLWRLEMLCAYADPNYGFLWFWCRENSLSAPREVLEQMSEELIRDVIAGGALWTYVWAVARDVFRLDADAEGKHDGLDMPMPSFKAIESSSFGSVASGCDAGLLARDFAVGSLRLARCFTSASGSAVEEVERRRVIFGSDILSV